MHVNGDAGVERCSVVQRITVEDLLGSLTEERQARLSTMTQVLLIDPFFITCISIFACSPHVVSPY